MAEKDSSSKDDFTKRDRLIVEYAPLVKYIANRIAMRLPPHIDVDDLINSGVLGLIDAIEKFDPSKEVKFKTYAEIRIKGAILDELRAMDWVPRSIRKVINKFMGAYHELEQQLGRPAKDEEMAELLGLEMEEFYKLLKQSAGVPLISLDVLVDYDDKKRNILSCLGDPKSVNGFGIMGLSEVKDAIAQAIDDLPEKEKQVISLYYYDELTMKEIGKVLDLTESRVSQIHTKAVLRLKVRIKDLKKI
ncbi:MAG: FliA/WhiG family RNA polymerase sigma factor [Deltaproteobacteria bacterium]|nr:FliA/WhiG family RNA polymerase sigma factor [Deltaproteobacteria bacterium]MBW2651731.1 FliA/WhiG family RNA polymerase sigma factor [Deltaproteobacteria bacterium]MCK5011682.1 FliA/WhiG family RNA polymerase sigma factor [Deltaproteobacteria bacterium]MCK5188289.1 FliA/WhiG family RNA polymerase sigma factor [Deltaproteobacteria bacterium]MCK5255237.1 FliA/WhiG family RNA polymerase sigma factor [Deltaproteobacteria bacterium]